MLIYTFNMGVPDLLLTFFSIVTIGTFLYSLWNIWNIVEERFRVKIFLYISVFAVVFHASTIAINFYFQGIIATIYGLCILTVFWKLITKKSENSVTN